MLGLEDGPLAQSQPSELFSGMSSTPADEASVGSTGRPEAQLFIHGQVIFPAA